MVTELHKNLTKARFIIVVPIFSTKPVSKYLTFMFKVSINKYATTTNKTVLFQ